MNRRLDVERRARSGDATVEMMMAAYSLDAVSHAATIGKTLDYSDASIARVEEILDSLERDNPKGLQKLFRKAPSRDDLEIVSKMYGGYIGEVMRFEWGEGDWMIMEDGPFAGAITLRYGDALTSPPAKVYKRITQGAGDNVYSYYRVLSDQRNGAVK